MSKINIEDIVKSKLDNYEMSYDNSWNEFEKKLNKKNVSYTKYYLAAAVAVIVGVLYFSFFNTEKASENNITKNLVNTKPVKTDSYIVTKDNKETEEPVNNELEKDELIISKSEKTNEVITENKTEEKSEPKIDGNNNQTEVEKVIIKENNEQEKISANFKANVLVGCEPLTVYFTPENTEKAEFLWKFSDGTTSKEKMPKHVFKNAGVYSVELVVKSDLSGKSISKIVDKYITVNKTPKAIFTLTNDENIYYLNGPEKHLSLIWQVDSKTISTDIDPEYEFKTIGESEIKLIVENEFNCKSDYSKTVKIEPVIQMAEAFTPDNNGDNELFGPVAENIDDYKYFLYIYNAYGKIIFKSNYANQAWNGKVNNSNNIAKDGSYIWKLEIQDNFGNKVTKQGQVKLFK